MIQRYEKYLNYANIFATFLLKIYQILPRLTLVAAVLVVVQIHIVRSASGCYVRHAQQVVAMLQTDNNETGLNICFLCQVHNRGGSPVYMVIMSASTYSQK